MHLLGNSFDVRPFEIHEDWQGRVEAEQDELHESITDMQSLVQQHAGQVQEMLRAVDCLLDQGHTAGLSEKREVTADG